MADEMTQRERLLAGVEQWNAWRADNPEMKINLRSADLGGADLRGADLSGATFCSATIDGVRVRKTDIGGPGWILCALTADEWELIQIGREKSK